MNATKSTPTSDAWIICLRQSIFRTIIDIQIAQQPFKEELFFRPVYTYSKLPYEAILYKLISENQFSSYGKSLFIFSKKSSNGNFNENFWKLSNWKHLFTSHRKGLADLLAILKDRTMAPLWWPFMVLSQWSLAMIASAWIISDGLLPATHRLWVTSCDRSLVNDVYVPGRLSWLTIFVCNLLVGIIKSLRRLYDNSLNGTLSHQLALNLL